MSLESDDLRGASRRDVLRGNAIGVGALVGGYAPATAAAPDAEAAGARAQTYLTLTGIRGAVTTPVKTPSRCGRWPGVWTSRSRSQPTV
jgi:hypothetical protein